MKDTQVLPAILQHIVAQDIDILHTLILLHIGEALTLHTRHVENIGLVDDLFREIGMLFVFEPMLVAEVLLLIRHTQLIGCHEMEGGVEMRHADNQ